MSTEEQASYEASYSQYAVLVLFSVVIGVWAALEAVKLLYQRNSNSDQFSPKHERKSSDNILVTSSVGDAETGDEDPMGDGKHMVAARVPAVVWLVNQPKYMWAFRYGAILGFTLLLWFVVELTDVFVKGGKTYDRDLFIFIAVVFLVVSLSSLTKNHVAKPADASQPARPPPFMGREMSEEWKGWLQFLFILYHYYNAKEVYNAIRVFVSCYVWMTGFGNFSFFYIRKDYTLRRFLQMMWRLNFLVIFCCLTLQNDYILYYIVPLHTFYFLMVFTMCRIVPSANYTSYVRLKLFVVFIFIVVVWEIPGVFDIVFAPLKLILATKDGSLYEWRFRTTLDHYSSLIGMICALSIPTVQTWFNKVELLSVKDQIYHKGIVGLILSVMTFFWYKYVYTMPKLEYNVAHPYFFFIPVATYIFFRNLTPTLRSYHVHMLAWGGQITLETYLAQHHMLLSSNAKTLWVVFPNYPLCNMLFVSTLYVLVSRQLFDVTTHLRDIFIPNNDKDMYRTFSLTAGGAVLLYLLAFLLKAFSPYFVGMIGFALGVVAVYAANVFGV